MKYETIPCTEEDEEFIEEKLVEIDDSIVPPAEDIEEEDFVFKVIDEEGNTVGGCVLEIDEWKFADLDILWVDEAHRRKGLGSALIRQAEKTAREKGCDLMILGTYDFQARPLYEKHGFTVKGTIRDWPRGHENYILTKRLDQPWEEYIPSNDLSTDYKIEPGTEEDERFIGNGLRDYNTSQAHREHKYIPLNKKIVDEEGNLIAAIIAGVESWNALEVDMLWVDEPYRNQGIGSELLMETEREAKEHGAYCALLNAYDWQVPLFRKHGYTECFALEDFPTEGHYSYEMEKRF